MLTGHLLNHENTPEEISESKVGHVEQVLGWAPAFRDGVISRAERDGLIVQVDGTLRLTPTGHTHAAKVLTPAAGGTRSEP